jgi:uncharacterized protein (TIGR02302 family)
MSPKQESARLRLARRAAFAVIVVENLTAVAWRLLSWIGLFGGLWLLQMPAFFGTAGPGLALLLFIGGLIWLGLRDLGAFRWPEPFAVDRRLEEASALRHRPLATLHDRLANVRRLETFLLWRNAKEKAGETIPHLRPPRPRPVTASRDPLALRLIAILLLLIGFIIAGPQSSERLRDGLFPYYAAHAVKAAHEISLWITPPAYTGLPPVVLNGGYAGKTIAIPAGSIVKAHVTGGWGEPKLVMGGQRLSFKKLDRETWAVESTIKPGHTLQIRQGLFARVTVPYAYIADKPPMLTVKGPPKILPKGQWQFDLSVQDDYGVTGLILHMKLDPSIHQAPLGGPVDDERPVMTPANKPAELRPVYDMTWHTWAGLPVIVTIEARDHLGQAAISAPMHLKLPERPFNHPVAQALIGMRKRLAWTPVSAAPNVAAQLEQLLTQPGAYNGDITVFLSLRSASSHLFYDPTPAAAVTVIPQLWDTALRIEEGDLPLAAQNFRQAQDNLQKLLNDPNATPDQIAAAMEKLRTTMGQYLSEIFRRIARAMAASGMPPLTQDQVNRILRPDDIQAFLDQLQAQALTGDKNAARDMLSQLGKMTDQLDPSMAQAPPKDMQFMAQAIHDLQDMIEGQKKLLAQTQADRNAGAAEQAAQDALLAKLEQLMAKAASALGQIPQPLQDAGKAMHASADALGHSQGAQSIPFQQQALDQLQKGQGQMAQQLRERMKQMMMMALGSGQLDPLGHPTGKGDKPGLLPESTMKIPDAQRKQVQDIMRTLRERSGQMNRPDYELDYYRRLMRQF